MHIKLLWIACAAAFLFASSVDAQLEQENRAKSARPNIVFVMTDDHAPTAIGFKNAELKTPHLDRFFQQNVELKNAFVTTPSGSSSRASLMTSRFGTELGITDWISDGKERQLGLDPKFPSWPKLLAKTGYRNGLVGKWHMGIIERFHPRHHGFHYFAGMRGGGNTAKDPVLEIRGKRQQVKGFTPDILTDHAIGFMQRNQKGPFLLCLHFRAPHIQWQPLSDKDWSPYKDIDPTLPDPEVPHLDTAKLKRWTREYYGSVSSVDRNFGRLLNELERLKLVDNTIVIFTTDHGYSLGQKGLWFKGNARRQLTKMPQQVWPYIPPAQRPNLFDQSLRALTAVRWPGVTKPNSVIDETVSNLDWFPTILEMAGAEIPDDVVIRGRSIAPLLNGENVEWDNDLYTEYSMVHMAQTHMRGWRTPKWKLSIDFLNAGRGELYNLQTDPLETENLFRSAAEDVREIREQLTARIIEKMKTVGDRISIDPTENQRELERISAGHHSSGEAGWGWEKSFQAGDSTAPNANEIHATEITHLVPHKGKLYAGNGYWMDARPGGKKDWAQVMALDSPETDWRIDLDTGAKHLRVTALKSVTFHVDANGNKIVPPANLLLAGSDGERLTNIWTRDDSKNSWTRTELQAGGQYKRSLRAIILHRDQQTGIDRIFAAAGELGLYSGVYDSTQPGMILWNKEPELGPGVVRPMSFGEANGKLYASSGTDIYQRIDGTDPRWEKVYSYGGSTSWAMGGIRGLTTIKSPNGLGESLLFTHKAQVIRLDPNNAHKATAEVRIPELIEKNLGIPVKGHTLAAYSSMLPVIDPKMGKTVHLIGVQSQLLAGNKKGKIDVQNRSFSGYYAGGCYLIREAANNYRVKEVNGRWQEGKPPLFAPRTYAISPFPNDNRLYFAGYDANFLPAVDSAWIYRASVTSALQAPAEVYELRTYTTNEGKLPNLNARFRDHTIRMFKKHGMESIGYWTPTDGAASKNTLIYLLKHKDIDTAQQSWSSFLADEEWKKIAKESNKDGPLLAQSPQSIFIEATGYSPSLLGADNKTPGVYELRTYTTVAGKLDNLNARFRNHTMQLFEKHGMRSIAYWNASSAQRTAKQPSDNTLVYLLKHKSRQAATASWQAFLADPQWQKVAAESRQDGPVLARKPQSVFLTATDYSPLPK